MASLTIGMKLGVAGVVVLPRTLGNSWRIARHQPKTCCEQICQRRATSDTRAQWHQGLRDNPCPLSSADQRRRHGPRENLNASVFTLRVIVNVKHKDSSMPSASSKSSSSGRVIEQGYQRHAYR